MNEETLLHAAQRVIRFVRVDDTKHGGLLSRETVKAVDILNGMVLREQRREAAMQGLADQAQELGMGYE